MKKKPVPLFIKEERAKGNSDEVIQDKLLQAGWHIDIIYKALSKNEDPKPKEPAPVEPSYEERVRNVVKSPYFAVGVMVVLILLAIFI